MAPAKLALVRTLKSSLSNQKRQLVQSASRAITTHKSTTLLNTNGPATSPPLFPVFQPSLPQIQVPSYHVRTRQPTHTPFDSLLNDITRSLTSAGRPSLPLLHTLLRAYKSTPDHWSKFAHRDSAKHYTRNLVYGVPDVFNLLLLVWTPGKESPVHDHADAHCLMKVLKGEIRESRFATPINPGEQGPLVQTSRLSFGLNKVSYMADQLGLHSIANPHPTEYAVSLHLYTPPNAAIRGCHIYDAKNGEATHVMQNEFHSVGGESSCAFLSSALAEIVKPVSEEDWTMGQGRFNRCDI